MRVRSAENVAAERVKASVGSGSRRCGHKAARTMLEAARAPEGLHCSVDMLDGPKYVRKDEILASSSKVITSITSTRWPAETTCT